MAGTKTFENLKTGDLFTYCWDGQFKVTKAYQKDGKTVKLTAKPVNGGDSLTLGPEDASLINL